VTWGWRPALAAVLVLASCSDATAPDEASQDPGTAPIITTDIVNFWEAYDNGGMNGTAVSRWLYNQGASTPDRPGDLG
jgi:hypothetical protein